MNESAESVQLNPVAQPMWTQAEAVALVQSLNDTFWEHGYCLAIGGGCLHKGKSDHDVDIIVLPLTNCERPDAVAALNDFERDSGNLSEGLYRWMYRNSERQKDVLLIRYVDFHTEKQLEFRFYNSTNFPQ